MKLKPILKSLLKEKTFEITKDVDYIYKNGKFQDFIKKYSAGEFPNKSEILSEIDVEFGRIESIKLPSSDAKQASLKKPVIIICGIFRSGNYYYPGLDKIQVSLQKPALGVLYDWNSYQLTPSQQKTIHNEITESRIKSSISHELSHWLDDVNHNSQVTKLSSKANELGKADVLKLGKEDVNLTYFEIDAQIHGIKAIHTVNKKKWDKMTLDDLFDMYTPLRTIFGKVYNKYGKDVTDIWQKTLIKRLDREGLLGKNMRKFVKG